MFITLILLISGIVLLVKGADFLVDGASSIARKFRISDLVVGLTIVAFGTSTPELFVNIFSVYNGNTEIAVGNIIGSNIFNIMIILGISSMIYPLYVTVNTVWKEIPLALLAQIILSILAADVLIDRSSSCVISRIDGIILLSFFCIFISYIIECIRSNQKNMVVAEPKFGVFKSVMYILFGLIMLTGGSKFMVTGAVKLALFFGVSESLIGLTIVACGTSLPELATSVVAALKKNADISVGNIIGSNIFNVFFIVGISSVIRPLPFDYKSSIDNIVAVTGSILLFIAMFTGKKKHHFERWEGIVFVVLYFIYLGYLIYRG